MGFGGNNRRKVGLEARKWTLRWSIYGQGGIGFITIELRDDDETAKTT